LLSNAWLLYVGVLFVVMVMFAPNGILGLIAMHGPIARSGLVAALIVPYLRVLLPGLMMVGAFVLLVEMVSFVAIGTEQGKSFKLGGAMHIDPFTLSPWVAAATALVIATVWLRLEARALGRVWDGLSDEAKRLEQAS